MATRFILGRGGTGKTRACLDAILAELRQPEYRRRLILLVPEQASFQMERALAGRAPGGGYTDATVLSFSRLARVVLDESGAAPTVLSSQARRLALRRVVAAAEATLKTLRSAARTGGFYVQLDHLLDQLLREHVSPEALGERAKELDGAAGGKVAEIARLYADYLAWLGPDRIDPALRLAELRKRLSKRPWLPSASIWVDGFAGFTGQELSTLVELARRARDVTITLLLDPASPAVQRPDTTPDSLGLFQRTEVTYQRLLRSFADAGVAVESPRVLQPRVPPRFVKSPALGALEHGFASPAPLSMACSDPADVRLHGCESHRDELREAARWIRTRVADSGGSLRYRDFALIARDLEPFAQLVAEVFTEYEIPFFLDRRRPLRGHPLSRFVPALFETVTSDFSVEPVVRLLRTRLLPLSRDQAEQLENVVCREVARGAAMWRMPAWELGQAGRRNPAFSAERRQIMAALEPLVSRTVATGADWARTLLDVLQGLGVRRRVETWIAEARTEQRWETAETHRLAWEAVCDVLDDLHEVLGETSLAVGDVAAIVASSLDDLTLGLAPPTLDQVLVSSIERSRHPDIKYAWLFAFNAGVFPAPPAVDTLLSTEQREALTRGGLPAPASHREDVLGERLLAYIALTRPSRGLAISYATVDDDGAPLLPSPLLDDVRSVLPGLVAARPDAGGPPVCLTEAVRGHLTTRQSADSSAATSRYERLAADLRSDAEHGARSAYLLRGSEYKNTPAPVGNYRASDGPLGVIWDASPSEIETVLQCPFKHFATYGLRLDAQRGPMPLRWGLGSVAHELLADVTRRAMREPGGVREVPDVRWLSLLDQAATDHRTRWPADLAQRRPDYVFLNDVLVGLLRSLVLVHAARWRRGGFEPAYCEQVFDFVDGGGSLRGLELSLVGGARVRMHGKVDRVDQVSVDDRTFVLVYDYKSGRGFVDRPYLTGAPLQLFLYLLALTQQSFQSKRVRAAGVLLAPLYADFGVLKTSYAAAASPAEQRMYMYRPRGLFAQEAAAMLDARLGSQPSPVVNMRLKKDGDFYSSSDVCASHSIEQRLELARQTFLQAAENIRAGSVDVAPLVEQRTLACTRCEFRTVCRFDRASNRPRAAEAALPQLEGVAVPEGGET